MKRLFDCWASASTSSVEGLGSACCPDGNSTLPANNKSVVIAKAPTPLMTPVEFLPPWTFPSRADFDGQFSGQKRSSGPPRSLFDDLEPLFDRRIGAPTEPFYANAKRPHADFAASGAPKPLFAGPSLLSPFRMPEEPKSLSMPKPLFGEIGRITRMVENPSGGSGSTIKPLVDDMTSRRPEIDVQLPWSTGGTPAKPESNLKSLLDDMRIDRWDSDLSPSAVPQSSLRSILDGPRMDPKAVNHVLQKSNSLPWTVEKTASIPDSNVKPLLDDHCLGASVQRQVLPISEAKIIKPLLQGLRPYQADMKHSLLDSGTKIKPLFELHPTFPFHKQQMPKPDGKLQPLIPGLQSISQKSNKTIQKTPYAKKPPLGHLFPFGKNADRKQSKPKPLIPLAKSKQPEEQQRKKASLFDDLERYLIPLTKKKNSEKSSDRNSPGNKQKYPARCLVCRTICINEKSWLDHVDLIEHRNAVIEQIRDELVLRGKPTKKQIRDELVLRDKPTKKRTSAGSKRSRSLEKVEGSSVPTDGSIVNLPSPDGQHEKEQRYQCKLCDVLCASATMLRVHLDSRRHAKAVDKRDAFVEKQKQKLLKSYSCEFCFGWSASELDRLMLHVIGRRHRRNAGLKGSPHASSDKAADLPKHMEEAPEETNEATADSEADFEESYQLVEEVVCFLEGEAVSETSNDSIVFEEPCSTLVDADTAALVRESEEQVNAAKKALFPTEHK